MDGLELETEKVADSAEDYEKEGKVRKDQTLSFNTIADMSIGDKKLGILKMDVDHLGLIFSMGLKKTTDKATNWSKIDRERRAFVNDLKSKIGKRTAEVLVRVILLSSL